jgi:microcystin-dependent protein
MPQTNVSYTVSAPQTPAVPVGAVMMWWGTAQPAGGFWLICNGATFSQVTYPDLFVFLGNSNVLPDMRGYFPRGLDTSGTVDPNGASRTIGSVQTSQLQAHVHNVRITRVNVNNTLPTASVVSGNQPASGGTLFTTTSTGGATETRAINKAVNFIIKAR